MKKLLIVPGNSRLNEKWAEACAEFFKNSFSEIYLQRYNHWITEDSIDITTELDKINNTVGEDKNANEWYICAKSVGTIISLMAVQKKFISPIKCIFFGMPLDMANEEILNGDWSALSDFSVPALVFHNNDDPVASYEYTKNKLDEMAQSVEFVQLEGNDHTYRDFLSYQDQIKPFLNI